MLVLQLYSSGYCSHMQVPGPTYVVCSSIL